MKKRGQISGEVLIYVLAIIVFSFTLFFGYKFVKSWTEDTSRIAMLKLENDASDAVNIVKADTYGTVKRKELSIPGKFKQICFVSSFNPSTRTAAYPDQIDSPYPLINNDVEKSKNKNMFLAPPGDTGFKIGDIYVDGDDKYFCTDIIGNTATLRLENMGSYVKVSAWPT